MLHDIYWREPLWLLIGLFPLLSMLLRHWKQKQQLNRYADPALQPWVTVPPERYHLFQYWRHGLQVIAWLMFALGASGPRIIADTDLAFKQNSASTMIILDLSRSMDADDIHPSRSQYARELVARWLQEDSGRLGLIVFAGHAHILNPPTSDQQVLTDMAPVLEQLVMPTHGSQLSEALQLAYQELPTNQNRSAIILLTDGDFSRGEIQKTRDLISQRQDGGNELHIVGIGSLSVIPLADSSGQWLTHGGEPAITRLNEEMLIELATLANGSYRRADPGAPLSVTDIWRPPFVKIPKANRGQVLWRELFPWLLLPGVFCYIASLMPSSIYTGSGRFLLMLLVSISVFNVRADNQQAYQAWQQGDFESAHAYYVKIEGYDGRMGEGASCFRSEDLECAVRAFTKAAWLAQNDTQRGHAGFNLGNTYFALGDFSNASIMYRDALRYLPGNRKVQNNLAFSETLEKSVRERLRQLNRERSERAGKGWRTGNIEPGVILNPDTGVSLVDPADDQPTQEDDNQSDIEELISRGLDHAQLAKGRSGETVPRYRQWAQSSKWSADAAERAALWQRLIEMEENIPGALDQQRVLPGIRPW